MVSHDEAGLKSSRSSSQDELAYYPLIITLNQGFASEPLLGVLTTDQTLSRPECREKNKMNLVKKNKNQL